MLITGGTSPASPPLTISPSLASTPRNKVRKKPTSLLEESLRSRSQTSETKFQKPPRLLETGFVGRFSRPASPRGLRLNSDARRPPACSSSLTSRSLRSRSLRSIHHSVPSNLLPVLLLPWTRKLKGKEQGGTRGYSTRGPGGCCHDSRPDSPSQRRTNCHRDARGKTHSLVL